MDEILNLIESVSKSFPSYFYGNAIVLKIILFFLYCYTAFSVGKKVIIKRFNSRTVNFM